MNIRLKIAFLIPVFNLLTGCSNNRIDVNCDSFVSNSISQKKQTDYVVGIEQEVTVGDKLADIRDTIDRHHESKINGYLSNSNFSLKFNNGELHFKKDQIYYSIYEAKDLILIQSSVSQKESGTVFMTYLPIDKKGKVKGNYLYYSQEHIYPEDPYACIAKKLEDHRNFKFTMNGNSDFSYIGKVKKDNDSDMIQIFREDLVYLGKSKNTIKLLHREYTGKDFIRSGFTHELSYDLDESNLIRYKNLKIQVLRATNESIRYIILSE